MILMQMSYALTLPKDVRTLDARTGHGQSNAPGISVQDANIMDTDDPAAETEDTKCFQAELAKARRRFAAMKHYPKVDGEDSGGCLLDIIQLTTDERIYSALKGGLVNASSGSQARRDVKFLKCWWEPLAWALAQLDWSRQYHETDSLPIRRQT